MIIFLLFLCGRIFSSEIYVEDCTLYDTNSYNTNTTLDIDLPSEFIITWESNRKSSSNSLCCLNIGVDDNNKFQIGTYGSSGANGLQERINGDWQTAQTTSNSSLNTIQSNTLKYENNLLSYTKGNQTVSKTPTISIDKLLMYNVFSNGLIQNVKVKPL